MRTNNKSELQNFFNLRELVGYVRVYFASKNDPIKRIVAKSIIADGWGWPLLTVFVLEAFWHFAFKAIGLI